jgi:Matrixin
MRFLLERRGMRLTLAALALCGLAVPSAAHAYCRTTTEQLPPNYSPDRGCYTQGLVLFWRNACVSYSINQDASRSIPYEEAQRVIDESFATWMNARCAGGTEPGISVSNIGPAKCSEIHYNTSSPNQNLIVFRDSRWPYAGDPGRTLGLTTVTFNAETGEIYDADMEINASARNLTTSDQVPSNGFDLASVVTHEAGHFLGLAHATDRRSTMYANYKEGTTALRSLTPDDIGGLCAIYPDTSTRIVSPEVSANETIAADTCDYNPRHGFTAECSVPKSKGNCAATPRPTASWATTGTIAVAVAGIFAARRRRNRAR